jgi:hemoglobin-like flavoprotein
MNAITNQQKILLHYSLLYLDQDKAGKIFYNHLMEAMPHTKSIFRDLDFQRQRFISFLIKAVHTVDEPGKLQMVVKSLSATHNQYNLKPSHFAVMGEVLIESLADALGDKYTPEMGDAWRSLYQCIAKSMLASNRA